MKNIPPFKLHEFKPFNKEHARLGAAFSTLDGMEVELLPSSLNKNSFITGRLLAFAHTDQVLLWNDSGIIENGHSQEFNLVMRPLGYVDSIPVYVGDELVFVDGDRLAGDSYTVEPYARNFKSFKWQNKPDACKEYKDAEAAFVISAEELDAISFAYITLDSIGLKMSCHNKMSDELRQKINHLENMRSRYISRQIIDSNTVPKKYIVPPIDGAVFAFGSNDNPFKPNHKPTASNRIDLKNFDLNKDKNAISELEKRLDESLKDCYKLRQKNSRILEVIMSCNPSLFVSVEKYHEYLTHQALA